MVVFMFRIARNQLKKEICPFCFDYFYIRNTPFRCTNFKCAPEVDTKYQTVWNDSRLMNKIIPRPLGLKGAVQDSVNCTSCNHVSHKRLCPHCHSGLPHTIGHNKNYIISVIGAKEAGKSHYLAVLINLFKKNLLDLNLTISPVNDETINRYTRDFYEPVFENGVTIDATKSGTALNNQPLVYTLNVIGKGIFDDCAIKKSVTLVFFDTAGEDLNDEDVMSTVNKYIYRSSGIILLIDPLQILSVRSQVSDTTNLPIVNTETADILTRTTNLIEKGVRLKPTEKIKAPLAISFSKFDAVLSLIDPQFQLQAVADHTKGFDNDDFESINSEMLSLLELWGGQDIVQLAQTRYKNFGFFGLSALGCNPHGSDKVTAVVPKRVEDPFLWLLYKNGIIKRARV